MTKWISLILLLASPAWAGSPIIWNGTDAKLLNSGSLIVQGISNNQAVVTGSSGNKLAGLAAGTSGNVMTSNGTTWISQAAAVANDPGQQNNLGLSASITSSTLVIALKQADGSTDPAAGSGSVNVSFRSATTTSGAYSIVGVTGALSLTLAATSSIGCAASAACTLYVYLASDSGADICASFTQFDERVVQSATANAGGVTSGSTLYCGSSHTSKPIRLIGKVTATWSNPNWGSVASPVAIVRNNDSNIGSNAPGLERIERATVNNGNGAACSVSKQSGAWLSSSGTRNGAGDCTWTIATGEFSDTPSCICAYGAGTPGTQLSCAISIVAESSTSLRIVTNNGGSNSDDANAKIICAGPR